jgi:hypothetical protein
MPSTGYYDETDLVIHNIIADIMRPVELLGPTHAPEQPVQPPIAGHLFYEGQLGISDSHEVDLHNIPRVTTQNLLNHNSPQPEPESSALTTMLPLHYGILPLVRVEQVQQVQHARQGRSLYNRRPSVRAEYGQGLPSREQFMHASNAEGLLALSDPRTDAHTNDGCTICKEDMSDLDEAAVLVQCGHIFHRSCLLPWLNNPAARVATCPLCRRNLFIRPRSQDVLRVDINERRSWLRHEIQTINAVRDRNTYDVDNAILWSLGGMVDLATLRSDDEIRRRIDEVILRKNQELMRLDEEESRLDPELTLWAVDDTLPFWHVRALMHQAVTAAVRSAPVEDEVTR